MDTIFAVVFTTLLLVFIAGLCLGAWATLTDDNFKTRRAQRSTAEESERLAIIERTLKAKTLLDAEAFRVEQAMNQAAVRFQERHRSRP